MSQLQHMWKDMIIKLCDCQISQHLLCVHIGDHTQMLCNFVEELSKFLSKGSFLASK